MIETHDWIPCRLQLPEEGKVVITKIEDDLGRRCERFLIRKYNTWFLEDMSKGVHLNKPTHWRYV